MKTVMNEELACSACGSRMIRGFIYDRGHYDYKQQQVWVEGEAESSFWSGLKTSGREVRTVDAYRCASCDRLEFYASEGANL